MALVFIDSFAHYNVMLDKWSAGDNALCSFNTNPSFIRTGPQSLNVFSEAFGTAPTIHFTNRLDMVAGTAWLCSSTLNVGGSFFQFYNLSHDDKYEVNFNANGSIFYVVNGWSSPSSAPGIINENTFHYVEAKLHFDNGGAYEIRVDGVVVLSGHNGAINVDVAGVDTFFIPGSAILGIYYNDLYVLDTTGGVNDDFLGAVQIWAIYPDANESPLDWTPLAGTNFSEVNQHPPPGDSAYVFDQNIGDIDQYHYNVTGPTGTYTIPGIQHGMDARLDAAGSHGIASQIGATTGSGPSIGTNAVGGDYHFVLQTWDTNPETAAPFATADFATTFVGPKIVS